MKVLVLNSGSSSLKFKVYEIDGGEHVVAKGMVERIGLSRAVVHCDCGCSDAKDCNGLEEHRDKNGLDIPDHAAAMDAICEILLNSDCGIINDISEIGGIGHRVVHGGEEFKGSVVIDKAVLDGVKKCAKLAPLHNPPGILGIEACEKIFPNMPQIAVFDTAFHNTIPESAFMYGIPRKFYTEQGVRKYGFHGTSHRYVSREAARLLDRPIEETKVITCHLGNGCSITAVQGGRSVDTSMGLTPLQGVMMGTRSGDLDPAIPLFLIKELGLTAAEVETTLNKKSGFKGLCDKADVRDIEALAAEGDKDCELALDIFAYRIALYIGSYAMAMNGVDAIVFTAGIGEHDASMRARILKNAGYLGIMIDPEKNAKHEIDVTTTDSTARVLVIPTDEELVIARDTARLVAEASG